MLLPHFSLIMSFWRVVPLLGVAFFSKWEVFTRSSHAGLYYTGTWHKPLNFLASWCKPEKIRGASRAQTHVPKPESQRLTRLSFVAVIPDITLSSRYVTAVCQDILPKHCYLHLIKGAEDQTYVHLRRMKLVFVRQQFNLHQTVP